MDSTAITLMGIIILLIFIVPFIVMGWVRKKRQRALVMSLLSVAEQDNCKITDHEVWNNRAIGIDKGAHKLFFIHRKENFITKKWIALSEIEKCRISRINRTMRANNETYFVIDKLELVFEFRDKNQGDATLEFYNSERDRLTPAEELQLIEKWMEMSSTSIAFARIAQIK